jgi:hypothetical protein
MRLRGISRLSIREALSLFPAPPPHPQEAGGMGDAPLKCAQQPVLI